MNTEMEIWSPVSEYEGLYEVSTIGRVRSLDRVVNCWFGPRTIKGRVLSPTLAGGWKGRQYLKLVLCKGDVQTQKYIHRLVASAFIDNPQNLPEVNHIDGDKKNNWVSNLEWCSKSDNGKHAYRIGLKKGRNSKGESNPNSVFTEESVRQIRQLLSEGITRKELSARFGANQNTINDICAHRNWKHVT